MSEDGGRGVLQKMREMGDEVYVIENMSVPFHDKYEFCRRPPKGIVEGGDPLDEGNAVHGLGCVFVEA